MITIPFKSLSLVRTGALFITLASLCSAADEGKIGIGAKIGFRGVPTGGTLTVGSVGDPSKPLSVQTQADDTLLSVMNKLAGLPLSPGPMGGFLVVDGTTGQTGSGIDVLFVRTTDAGLIITPSVVDLTAHPVHSSSTVQLSWRFSDRTPDQIIVRRGNDRIAKLSGTALGFNDIISQEEANITYRVICYDFDAQGIPRYPSDYAEVKTMNPEIMKGDAFIISTPGLPNGVINKPYEKQIIEEAGTDPVQWSLISGNLPGGLTLTSAGVITGTPAALGTFTIRIQVRDALGAVRLKDMTLIVKPIPTLEQVLHIDSPDHAH